MTYLSAGLFSPPMSRSQAVDSCQGNEDSLAPLLCLDSVLVFCVKNTEAVMTFGGSTDFESLRL